jgi:site-specific DNA-methyltransferase (adenine-specific)
VVWVVNDATINGSETLTSFKQALYFNEVGFNVHDTMIWRRRTTPQTSNRYEPAFEYMFIFSKGKLKTFNPIKQKPAYEDNRKKKTFHRKASDGVHSENEFTRLDSVMIDNIWDIPNRGNDKLAHKHPAIFPEDLVKKHIYSWSNEGDLVYDPFMGSGTTAKMAHLQKRNWIGSEMSKEYIDLANNRLKPYLDQTTLF